MPGLLVVDINCHKPLSSGESDHNWKIAHVTLTEEKKFRYLFQGTKGDPKNSVGGIFLDDVTLTETPCPAGVWTIRNISQLLADTVQGEMRLSPRFYSSEGYGIGVTLYPNGRATSNSGYLGLSFHLYSGENDAILEWPVENRQAIMTILDQDPDVRNRMSLSLMFTTSRFQTSAGRYFEKKQKTKTPLSGMARIHVKENSTPQFPLVYRSDTGM